ncbi:MAG: nuclear transport factor 2 family protein [Gemmatimonadetes bacterium]|nr:nuclear transport factor 2 family protein [Gemmatimonadota bacterium]
MIASTSSRRPLTPRAPARSGLAGLLALTFVAAACSSGGAGPSQVQAENEIAIRTLLSMVGSGNADDVAGLFHPDAVYDDYANQHQYRGLEEIAGYVAGGTRWATAVSMDVMSVHVSDSAAVAEWVFTGIQDRPIRSILPLVTGREVVLYGVTLIEMEDGRIRRAADYVDVRPLVLQLGGEVHMPGGGILRQEPAEQPSGEEAAGAEALTDTLPGGELPVLPDTIPLPPKRP